MNHVSYHKLTDADKRVVAKELTTLGPIGFMKKYNFPQSTGYKWISRLRKEGFIPWSWNTSTKYELLTPLPPPPPPPMTLGNNGHHYSEDVIRIKLPCGHMADLLLVLVEEE